MSSFIALDFETADYSRSSACAIGIVRVVDLKIVEKISYLIRPPARTFRFTDIHGITWEDVKNQLPFSGIWPRVRHYFEEADFVVAHNVAFDRSVLEACCYEYCIDVPDIEYRCTLQLSRKYLDLERYRLNDVSENLGFELYHHQVMSDAVVCAMIMIYFMEKFNA